MSEIVKCYIVITRKLQQVGLFTWKHLLLTTVSVLVSLLLSVNPAGFVQIINSLEFS